MVRLMSRSALTGPSAVVNVGFNPFASITAMAELSFKPERPLTVANGEQSKFLVDKGNELQRL